MVGPPPASWAVIAEQASATEQLPGLWRLRLPTAWEGIATVNAWAVRRDDGLLLVDCGGWGDQSCWPALERAVSETGHSISEVRVLAATHAHSDHIGVAARLVERTGCRFLMHPDHAHFYDAMRKPRAVEQARLRRARLEGVPERMLDAFASVSEEVDAVMAPVEPDDALVDGVVLESALGDWQVIETPGHAPSHVCLYQADSQALILGDLVAPRFVPYYDYGYSHDPIAQYLQSLQRIEAIPVKHALPGHGRPLRGLPQLLADHREGVHQHLAAVRAALAAGPAPAYEIMVRATGEPSTPFGAVWVFVGIYCCLRHLRLAGEAVRESAADETFRHRLA